MQLRIGQSTFKIIDVDEKSCIKRVAKVMLRCFEFLFKQFFRAGTSVNKTLAVRV